MTPMQPLRAVSRAAVSQILLSRFGFFWNVFLVFILMCSSFVVSGQAAPACSWNAGSTKILLQTVPSGATCATLLNTGDAYKTFGPDYPWIALPNSSSFSVAVSLAFYREYSIVKTMGTNETYLRCSGSFVGAAVCTDSTVAPVTEQPPLTDPAGPIRTTVPPETAAPTMAPTPTPEPPTEAPTETPAIEGSKQSSVSKFFQGIARGFNNLSLAAKAGIIVSMITAVSTIVGLILMKVRQRCGKVKARYEAPKTLNVGASEHVIEGNCTVEIVRSPRAKAVRTLHILTPFPVIGNIKSRS